jgi:hypothetical protein
VHDDNHQTSQPQGQNCTVDALEPNRKIIPNAKSNRRKQLAHRGGVDSGAETVG